MKNHVEGDQNSSFEHLFDEFVTAATCKTILGCFHQLQDSSRLLNDNCTYLYEELKARLKGSWRAQSLFSKLDKKAAHKDYNKGKVCSKLKVLIIGAGPCGLRTAIECAFLGAKTVVVEKRDRFSRNNVLHLWPYLISDLKSLGAKKLFGKFCAGAIDHISIRQLQCILLKVALLVGVEVHVNVTFDELVEPSEHTNSGWKCKVTPKNHVVSDYEFDVIIGADGKRNTLSGFKRKEFRGKLALAITANFINRNTQAEARVEEISGVAFIFNQKFFLDLKESTGIDLENIVYYKDDTHYFVMTAKKGSLLEKGVLKQDFPDTVALLDKSNVNQEALMAYAREAADFSTHYQLPSLDYAVNHYGQADVAMFDFTSMFAADNASRFIVKNGCHLLMGLVGDSLLEPFWPTGSGCARGFLSAFDAAWMIRSWAMGKTPLQVLVERESIYTLLSQTTTSYLNKNYNMYSIDPSTRYLNLNLKAVKPNQVRHLYQGGMCENWEEKDQVMTIPSKKSKSDILSTDSQSLLEWCKKVLNTGNYQAVHIVDFTSSWHSGLAICALIHFYRPDLIDYAQLLKQDIAANNQLAFNVAEKELGIPPVMTGEDMASCVVPDKLTMISYLTQFYDLFRHEPDPSPVALKVTTGAIVDVKMPRAVRRSNRRVSILQKLNSRLSRAKKRKEQEKNEGRALRFKNCKDLVKDEEEQVNYDKLPMENESSQLYMHHKKDTKLGKGTESFGTISVASRTDILTAKFKSQESSPLEPVRKLKCQPSYVTAASVSEVCYFCQKRVYIMERVSAEGQFFHRSCLKCDHCGTGLRLSNYSCDRDIKPVKFYCYRHAVPEMRVHPQRKPALEKNNIPDIVIAPVEQVSKDKFDQKYKDAFQSHVIKTIVVQEEPKYTPERIEFEISFDGIEESEEEQSERNLHALDVLPDDDTDSESSNSNDNTCVEDLYAVTSQTVDKACALKGSLKEQLSPDRDIDIPERSDTTDDIIKRFCDIKDAAKENFSINNKNRVEGEQLVRNKDLYSVLKSPCKNLKINEKARGSVVNNRSETCSELVKTDEKPESLEKANARKLHGTICTSTSNNNVCENLLLESSYLATTGVFIEGHLSPSANRIRRFCKKRRINEQQMLFSEQRNSKENKTTSAAADKCQLKFDLPARERANRKPQSELVRNKYENTTKHENLSEMEKLKAENNSCHKVVESLTENLNPDILSFRNVDDKFVTDRRYRHISKVSATFKKQSNLSLRDVEQSAMDSSFSISTPSDSESSITSVELDESDVDNIKSHQDRIIQDFPPTTNLAPIVPYNMDQTNIGANLAFGKNLLLAKLENDCNNNEKKCAYAGTNENEKTSHNISHHSLHVATDGSKTNLKKNAGISIQTKISLTRPLPPPGSHCPQSHKSIAPSHSSAMQYFTSGSESNCNNATPSSKTGKQNSPVKEIGLSTVDSNFEASNVNKQSANYALPSKHAVFTKLPNRLKDSPLISQPLTSQFAKCSTDQPAKYLSSKVNSEVPLVFSNEHTSGTKTGTSLYKYKTLLTGKLDDALSNSSVLSEDALAAIHPQSQKPEVTENRTKHKLGAIGYKPHEMNAKKEIAKDSKVNHAFDGDSSILDNSVEVLGAPKSNEKPSYLNRSQDKEKLNTCFASVERTRAMCPSQPSEHDIAFKTALSNSKACKSDSVVLSSQQIRDNFRAGREKARIQARQKAKLKTDEELGISTVSPVYSSKEQELNRNSPERVNSHSQCNKSYGTNSVSGIMSNHNSNAFNVAKMDETHSSHSCQPLSILSKKNNLAVINSEKLSSNNEVPIPSVQPSLKPDNHFKFKTINDVYGFDNIVLDRDKNIPLSTHIATSAVTEGCQISQQAYSKGKMKKSKKDIKDKKSDKSVTSFLARLGLTKVKKKGTEHCNVTSSPQCSIQDADLICKDKPKKKKRNRKNVNENNTKPSKTSCLHNQDTASEYSKNLSVFSVFHTDSNKQVKNLLDVRSSLPATTLTSRSHADERSDSDDNSNRLSPMERKMTQTLDERVAQCVHRINQKQQKQAEQKRLRMAQEIQRQLEEVEVREKDLEERGVIIEKALRGDSHEAESESQLMSEWFMLVIERNALLRYESELLVRAKELELEDRQTRLEFQFREHSQQSVKAKTDCDLATEESLLEELLDVVEQRNSLVTLLEEDRLREQKEDNDLKEMMARKGHVLSSLSFDTWQEMKTT
ncbi:hypothetical protein BsWGS_28034 [Bradybaena similaris]